MEETLLQVQTQLLEAMEGGEALAAEVVVEALAAELATIIPLMFNQQQMEAAVEREVMEAVAVEEVWEEASRLIPLIQEREVQEILAVLEGEVEAVEVLDTLAKEIMVVMAQQEGMAEVGGVEVLLVFLVEMEVMVAAALAVLD